MAFTQGPLPTRLRLTQGLGAMAFGVKDNGFSFFLLIFYNQVLGMDAGLVGLALIDGNRSPEVPFPTRAIVKGDMLEPCISAASILAKVARDAIMVDLDRRYPQYQFAQHKGYPTPQHLEALSRYGLIDEHRRTFGPCRILTQ